MLTREFWLVVATFTILASRGSCSETSTADAKVIADQICREIIDKFNRDDFHGIYQMAAPEFKAQLSFERFDDFFKSLRNGGDILSSSFVTWDGSKAEYSLRLEARNMTMTFVPLSELHYKSIGFVNDAPKRLETPRLVATSNRQASDLDIKVHDAVSDYFRQPTAVGLSIGILLNGRQHEYHYGETRKSDGRLPSSTTVYEIGSITKTMTATILATAVVEGKVNLTDDVRKYLVGEYPNLIYDGKVIELVNLANHTSGLPSLPQNLGSQNGYRPLTPEKNYGTELFNAALKGASLRHCPGEAFKYSNWGASLLGQVLEEVYGEKYAQLLKKHVTAPLGMKNTTYGNLQHSGPFDAVGYFENGLEAPPLYPSALGPCGDVRSDLKDMLRYLNAQVEKKTPAIELTHKPTFENTGLGWGVREIDGCHDIQHNGSTVGFTTHISAILERKSGCVILSNSKADLNDLIVELQQIVSEGH